MRRLEHCNIVKLKYFFYSSGDKVRYFMAIEFLLLQSQSINVHIVCEEKRRRHNGRDCFSSVCSERRTKEIGYRFPAHYKFYSSVCISILPLDIFSDFIYKKCKLLSLRLFLFHSFVCSYYFLPSLFSVKFIINKMANKQINDVFSTFVVTCAKSFVSHLPLLANDKCKCCRYEFALASERRMPRTTTHSIWALSRGPYSCR